MKCGAGEGWRRSVDRSCEKWSITYSQAEEEYPSTLKSNVNGICQILPSKYHLKHITEGNVEEENDEKTKKNT